MTKDKNRGYVTVGVISIIFTAAVYLLPTLPHKIGILYTNFTNPIGYFIDAPVTKEPIIATKFQEASAQYIFFAEGYSTKEIRQFHLNMSKAKQNFLIEALTFNNDTALENLIKSQMFGQYFLPYSIYLHDDSGKVEYFAKKLNAPSVLLYGYSWVVNIPVKILAQIKTLIWFDDISMKTSLLWIDFVTTTLALIFIEFPIAIFNTLIGFFVALIFHPWDSICSVFGFVYFFFYTTLSAVWDFILVLIK